MKLSQIPPALAQNFGYDVMAMNDTEKVTVVRRKIVYEELVMSKDEFEQLNNNLEEDEDFSYNELNMTNIGFEDLTNESIEYTAFPGDVTSFTDDAITFMFENVIWSESFEQIQVAS